MKNFLKTCLAVLLGFMLGAAIYHPKTTKASGVPRIWHVQVSGDSAAVPGSALGQMVALSCSGADCYVLMQGN
jgi:hypothetical protein